MSEIIKTGQQDSINYCGHSIDTDGIYGAETKANCIRCLQHAMNIDYGSGLDEDGIFGPLSSNALSGHYVKEGETQEVVRAVQIALECKGYNPNGVDSVFGNNTWVAVCDFQRDNGLTVDGIVGADTFTKLFDITIQTSTTSESDAWTKYDPSNLPNFELNEFDCQCGCGLKTHDELKCKIQCIRDDFASRIGYDVPFLVTDGARCPTRNAQEGGTSNSLHLEGWAVDIQTKYDGRWYTPDAWQDIIREIAHTYGLTTGNYYGDGGGWVHIQKGRTDYNEYR